MAGQHQFYTHLGLARCVINITSVRTISTRAVLAALGLCLATACEAAVITPPGLPPPGTDAGPVGEDPRAFFDANVAPLLAARCRTCHELDEPQFLVADAYYESVKSYSPSLFVPGEPENSLLVTYPGLATHTGMDWASETERDTLREWIVLEGMFGEMLDGGMGDPLSTTPQSISPNGPNSLGLESIGLAGCRVEFDTMNGTSGLRITNIIVYAGGSGLAISGARFVLVDPDAGTETETASFTTGNPRIDPGRNMSFDPDPVLPEYTTSMMLGLRFDSAGTL